MASTKARKVCFRLQEQKIQRGIYDSIEKKIFTTTMPILIVTMDAIVVVVFGCTRLCVPDCVVYRVRRNYHPWKGWEPIIAVDLVALATASSTKHENDTGASDNNQENTDKSNYSTAPKLSFAHGCTIAKEML